MKLSEKYLDKQMFPEGKISENGISEEAVKLYGDIRALEAQQTLLVSNPDTFPQERYIDKLSEIVEAIEKIKIEQQL